MPPGTRDSYAGRGVADRGHSGPDHPQRPLRYVRDGACLLAQGASQGARTGRRQRRPRRAGAGRLADPLSLHRADRYLLDRGLGWRIRGGGAGGAPCRGAARRAPALAPYAGPLAFGAVVVAITFTLTEVLEAPVGEVPDADQPTGEPIVRREDGSWLVDGLLAAKELEARLGLGGSSRDEEEADYQTVGGMVMDALGRVPAAGDRFEHEGYAFEVLDMDGRRVDKVLVALIRGADAEGAI